MAAMGVVVLLVVPVVVMGALVPAWGSAAVRVWGEWLVRSRSRPCLISAGAFGGAGAERCGRIGFPAYVTRGVRPCGGVLAG